LKIKIKLKVDKKLIQQHVYRKIQREEKDIDKKERIFIRIINDIKYKYKLNLKDSLEKILFFYRLDKSQYKSQYNLLSNLDKLIFDDYYEKIHNIIKNDNLEHYLFEVFKNDNEMYKEISKEIKETYKSIKAVPPKEKFLTKKPFQLKDGLIYNPRMCKNITRKINKCKYIIGFDTETYEGKCKLLCKSIGRDKAIYNPTFLECLQFLFYNANKNGGYRFFWNIDFDIQAILKLYDLDDKLEFIDHLSKGIEKTYRQYKLKWIRGKFFYIKNTIRKKNVYFTDLCNFYNLGLGIVGKIYLNETKFGNINAKRLNIDLKYWNKNREKIIKYCIQDCKLTEKLGNVLIDSIDKKDLPKWLVSGASISKQYISFDNFIPSVRHAPINIVQIAYQTYFGGHFDIYKRGIFKKLFLNDINSQYPFFIKDLPDMVNGYWSEYSKRYKNKLDKLPKNQTFGFFLCQVDIPEKNKVSTLPHKCKNNIVKFANGFHWSWYTWYDLDLMRDYIINIKRAYIFKPNLNNFKPFEKKIEIGYEVKNQLKGKDEMKYNTQKVKLNGIYGCFIERQKRITIDKEGNEIKKIIGGKFFNPIYATQITAFGRWSVIKDLYKSNKLDCLCGIHTDSLLTDKNISKYLDNGKNIGQWNEESKKIKHKKGLILNTGMYQIGRGRKKIFKCRGIPKILIKDWFRLCKKNKKEESKLFLIKHMKKVRESIIQDKSINQMNKMVDIERTVNINSDSKRHWYSNFGNFGDILKKNICSLPYYRYNNHSHLNPNPYINSKQEKVKIKKIKKIFRNLDNYNYINSDI